MMKTAKTRTKVEIENEADDNEDEQRWIRHTGGP